MRKFYLLNVISTFFVIIVLVSVSLAWMSKNRETSSSGMKVNINVSSNLVISAKNGTVGEGDISISEMTMDNITNISYTWGDSASKLLPATHNWTTGTSTGLVYCKDPNVINSETGLSSAESDNSDIVYEKVPVYDGGDCYYIDYVVYIAAIGASFSNVTNLNASLTETGSPLATDTNTAYKSTSVDFYIQLVDVNQTITASSNNYKGTINLADTTKTINLLADTSITTIPLNTTSSICVLMRCYFDGALTYTESSVTKAYVNSKILKTDSIPISFDITFVAE